MTIKSSTAAAWILAAGLFACMGAPSFAAEVPPWPTSTGVATVAGEAAYRIARTLELRGGTLQLPGAPVRLARRDTARLHVGAGASLALGPPRARAGRIASRLLVEEEDSLESAVAALDAEATALAALLQALDVGPRLAALAAAPLAGAVPVLAARGGPLGWGRWIAAVLAGYRAFVVQAKLWERRAEAAA